MQEHAVISEQVARDWMDYMDTASRLYRYSFSDQLLDPMHSVQTQQPVHHWNYGMKMLRWVNRGARGIALFDETWQNTKLRYVFDIWIPIW